MNDEQRMVEFVKKAGRPVTNTEIAKATYPGPKEDLEPPHYYWGPFGKYRVKVSNVMRCVARAFPYLIKTSHISTNLDLANRLAYEWGGQG